jgi:hypothetical protein
MHPGLGDDVRIAIGVAGPNDALQVSLEISPHQELWMEHLTHAPPLAQHLHGDRVDQEGPVVGDDLYHGGAASGPTVVGLARRPDLDHSPSGGPVHRCSVMTFDQTQEILNAALVDIVCVDMPEIVLEEHLDSVRVLPEFGGDLRPPSGHLCDLLGLLLLEFDLESGHVYHPIIAATPRCVATSDISPPKRTPAKGWTRIDESCRWSSSAAPARVTNQRCLKREDLHTAHVLPTPMGALPRRPCGARRSQAVGESMSAMDISSQLDFAGQPTEVYAMMTDRKYLDEVCVASGSLSYHVSVEGSTTKTSRTLPAPDSAQRFTGPELTVNEEVVWEDPSSNGSRNAAVTMTVLGQPVTFRGKLQLSPGGRGSVVDVTGELKVAIPLLGKKLEESTAPSVKEGYKTQQEVGDRWLAP